MVATAVGGYAIDDSAHADSQAPLGPGLVTVDVGIQHSHFSFSTLRVRPGTLVEFHVHNDDPIAHEFIVGDFTMRGDPRFGVFFVFAAETHHQVSDRLAH